MVCADLEPGTFVIVMNNANRECAHISVDPSFSLYVGPDKTNSGLIVELFMIYCGAYYRAEGSALVQTSEDLW